ncbi:uncharacterized protein LOC136039363 isoform X3 [Artemia franciscana]|uniref:uncharacterized protein LOC136039363 isoform X3 n=1 Tax=Artemia franciscana TaxID=6661 RepID=UPI0032DB625C
MLAFAESMESMDRSMFQSVEMFRNYTASEVFTHGLAAVSSQQKVEDMMISQKQIGNTCLATRGIEPTNLRSESTAVSTTPSQDAMASALALNEEEEEDLATTEDQQEGVEGTSKEESDQIALET